MKHEILPSDYEEKTFPFEVKELTDEGTFEGYAAIFNTPDEYKEIIEPGAFANTLKEGKTRPLTWYHDVRNPLGLTDLSVDSKGLKILGTLNLGVQLAKEKHSLMKQKVIRGLSIGFKTIEDAWDEGVRTLKEIKLYEIALCTFQVHPAALISAVKAMDHKSFNSVLESLKANIDLIEEMKVGKMISTINMKLLTNAATALLALIKAADTPKGTPSGGKSLLFSTLEALRAEPTGSEKKGSSLFGSTIKALENSNKE